jgi:hypothetical protein
MVKVNPFYLQGLNKKDTKKHKKYIIERIKNYKKGKFTLKKPKLKSYKNKKSTKVISFEKKYGIKITNSKKIEEIVGIPRKAQKEILDKGRAAFFTSGSRPNQNPNSWAYGRLSSVILKQGAYKYDKSILNKYSVKIKQPEKLKRCKSSTKKDKRCRRMKDGKIFEIPRKYSKKQCLEGIKGYSMKSSCAPYI